MRICMRDVAELATAADAGMLQAAGHRLRDEHRLTDYTIIHVSTGQKNEYFYIVLYLMYI
jgi:hypothetical protein